MTDRPPVRLLVVDDNARIRQQVLRVLPDGFEVVSALADGAELLAAIEAHHPDLVLLDITLPGENGIALATRIRDAGYRAGIVFLTVHDDPDYVRAALAAGARGYVVKSRMSSDLAPALVAAMDGRRFVSILEGRHS